MKNFALLVLLFSAGSANACFLSGEQVSGMNKICYYNCVSGTKAITISAVALCPLSLNNAPTKDVLAVRTKPLVCKQASDSCKS